MSSNRRVETLIDAVPREVSVLDVGCVQHSAGKADNDDWVHARLYDIAEDVVGVDYLEDEVQRLRERGYNVVAADAEEMDLGRRFDVVVAGELIEHLSNPGAFLDSARDHLESSGTLLLTTPNPWAFHHVKQAVLGGVDVNEEHTCWYDEATITTLLTRHGFEVEEVAYVKASDPGITSVLYDLGLELLGGTSLLVVASRDGGTDVGG